MQEDVLQEYKIFDASFFVTTAALIALSVEIRGSRECFWIHSGRFRSRVQRALIVSISGGWDETCDSL